MNDFWHKLPKPIFALAPMANVTDAVFRTLIARYGKPDVMWTEFVSVDGLLSKGKERLLPDLWFGEEERPIVAQIFGSKPEHFTRVAELIASLGFDGIDINMGCPDRAVERQHAGAALIKNPALAKQIILATKKGAPHLPVSVKTRTGYAKEELESWLPPLLETELSALTIHGRTRNELSLVPARWEEIQKAVTIIHDFFKDEKKRPIVLGNGDVASLAEAEEKVKTYGVDGVMIGRGIFGNPWCFNKKRPLMSIPLAERFKAMIEHTYLFEKRFADIKAFEVMKKHYKAYVNGFDGAKELREQLMDATTATEVELLARAFLSRYAPKSS